MCPVTVLQISENKPIRIHMDLFTVDSSVMAFISGVV